MSTPVVYHQCGDHAGTQIIANVMKAAFSPSSTCEHVSLNLKSACFVPCESCMAAAAVKTAPDQFSSLVLWCLCGRAALGRVHGLRCGPAGCLCCLGSCPARFLRRRCFAVCRPPFCLVRGRSGAVSADASRAKTGIQITIAQYAQLGRALPRGRREAAHAVLSM